MIESLSESVGVGIPYGGMVCISISEIILLICCSTELQLSSKTPPEILLPWWQLIQKELKIGTKSSE